MSTVMKHANLKVTGLSELLKVDIIVTDLYDELVSISNHVEIKFSSYILDHIENRCGENTNLSYG